MMLAVSKSKVLERSGFSTLYTFTPFKLLKSRRNEYVIQLIKLSSFKIYPEDITWNKGIQDKFVVPLKHKDRVIKKKVITPQELTASTFNPSTDRQYVYLRYSKDMKHIDAVKNAQEHISLLNKGVFKRNLPIYVEFSYKSLQEPYICRQGYVLLSSSENCPLATVCPKMKLDESNKCKYYVKVNNTYAGLYHVFPLIKKRFEVLEDEVEDIMIIPYDGLPLIKMGFTEKGEVTAIINIIALIPKKSWLFFIPRFYLYPQPTIGVKLRNIHAMIFRFDTRYLEKVVTQIIQGNDDVYKWLILKYVSSRLPLVQKGSTRKLVDGFKGFDTLASIFRGIADGDVKSVESLKKILSEKNKWLTHEDFINYVTFVLVHTLAHVMLTVISTVYDVPEDVLAYYINHPILHGKNLHEGEIELVIFEDAIGGFGYIKNLINAIKEKKTPTIFRELLNYSLELLINDDKRMIKALNSFKNNVDAIISEMPNEAIKNALTERIKRIWNFVEETHIYPHVIALRKSILSGVELKELDEYMRNMLEEVFSNAPLCWDSCPHCVILERGCTYAVFDQAFAVSKSLVKSFLVLLIRDLEKTSYSIYFTQVSDYVNELIKKAKREILISTASLSPITVSTLSSILSENPRLKVKILAYTESINDVRVFKKLKENLLKHGNFEVHLHDKLHAKGILIDNLILLKGSFNFTKRGLEVNVENIDIVYHPEEIAKFKEGFEKIWKESKSLTRLINE